MDQLAATAASAAHIVTVLGGGAVVTVEITLAAFLLALAVGLPLALLRRARQPFLRWPAALYVEVLRGLPPLTLLFLIYFGLAYQGLRLQPLTAAILGLGLVGGAYMGEIFRAALAALHPGQREAALAVGMTPRQALRYALLPQAWHVALPPVSNYAIGLLKDTAIVSAIAAPEIMFWARNLVTSTYETTLIYVLAALLYFALSFPLARLADRLERRRAVWRG